MERKVKGSQVDKSLKKSGDAWESGEAARRWKLGELRGNKIDPDRFVKMAGAMEAALQNVRKLALDLGAWEDRVTREVDDLMASLGPLVPRGAVFVFPSNLETLTNQCIAIAEQLRHGLKARIDSR